MELNQLRYFQTVARTGKIASAAQELFVSAPALSTAIARLEKEVGMPLFDRTGNRIALNTQGTLFLQCVDEVFNTLDRGKTQLRQSLLRQNQHIAMATTGSNLWMELITAFSQEFPRFTLTCTTTDHTSIEHIFDQYTFLFAETEEIPDSCANVLDHLFLFEDEPAILVHPDHPLAREKCVSVDMLRGENLLLPAQNMPRRERLIRLLQAGGIDPNTTTSGTYVIYRNMVQQNLGVAFTTRRSRHVNLGELRVIPLQNDLSPWRMHLYWRHDHSMTPAEQTFRTFAQEYFRA